MTEELLTRGFLKIVNMSVSAGWLVLAVLVLRLLLKQAPKWTAPALWGIVGLRLICPFSIESVFSLIPSAETVSPEIMMARKPAIDSGVPILNQAVNPVIAEHFTPNPAGSANPLQIWLFLAAVVWLIGMAAMLLYALVSYLRLRKRVGTAVRLRDNIFQSENVPSPFVLGVVRPRIYLPFDLGEEDMVQVLAHEEGHIARRDHWWKPLGFLLLSVHWFNPLLWAAYVLLCRDIELACDERVVGKLEPEARADYSQALLECSVRRRFIAACPLAFGEVGVKERVKRVLSYKKPGFWVTAAAAVACAAVAVCFLTDPVRGETAAGDVVWRDEDYGEEFPYELRLPESWRGRFDTLASLSRDAEEQIDGYSVEFHQHKRSSPGLDGLVFTLTVRPDEGQTIEEIAASMPPVPSAYLGRGGGWIYYAYFASDVRVDPANRSVAREYQEMRSDAEAQLGPDSFTYLGEGTGVRPGENAGTPAMTMDLLREIVGKGDFESVDFAAYSNAARDDLGTAQNYYLSFPLEYQGKSYRLDVSRMKDDNSLSFVILKKLRNGEMLWLYREEHENPTEPDLDGFLARDYDIRNEVSWTTPAGLTETECRMDYGPAGGVLLKPDAYEPLGGPESWFCPPEWAAAGMVAEYYTGMVEWNGAEIGMVYEYSNHTDQEPLGPVDGLCAPAYLIRCEHDLYTVNDLAQLEEQGVDTESLETTSDYWYVWFARPGEEKGVVISLNAKNFTREDVLEFARSVRY